MANTPPVDDIDRRIAQHDRQRSLRARIPDEEQDRLREQTWVIARKLLGAGYDEPPFSFYDAYLEHDREAMKRVALAYLEATEIVRAVLDDLVEHITMSAGRLSDVTYAELGAPFGITKQAARRRWPLAIRPDERSNS
jgi:hypothetical protein